jgi:hypothetical protein
MTSNISTTDSEIDSFFLVYFQLMDIGGQEILSDDERFHRFSRLMSDALKEKITSGTNLRVDLDEFGFSAKFSDQVMQSFIVVC